MASSKQFVVACTETEYRSPEDTPFLVYNQDGQSIFFGSIEEANALKKDMSSIFTRAKYKVGRVILEDESGFNLIPEHTIELSKQSKIH